jgi:predicted DCC family thiol-disulfide oxidoreductase YuxK
MSESLTTTRSPADEAAVCVYFDGACPICTAEIAVYRRSAPEAAVRFLDIANPEVALPPDISRAALLARFHVRDSRGRLHSGARGFAALWSAIPRFRWLGRIASVWPVTLILELGYRGFLKVRPLWRRPRAGVSS